MKESMIPLGRFFFKWRNLLFPLIVVALFALLPPAETILGSAQLESLLDALGIALVTLGVVIRLLVIGYGRIARNGTNKTADADELFTKGMFGISRNSLYLGNLTIYTGVFMLHGTLPVFLTGVGLFLFIYYAIIFSEEAFLAGKFGDSFTRYCQTVPRLLPKLSNKAEATKGMQLDWKIAIYSEYNIITQSVLIVALSLWYENYSFTGAGTPPLAVIILLATISAFALTIRTVKRQRRKADA